MGSGDYMQRAQQLKTQQDLTNSAADTTASLQRTRQLMAEVPLTPSTCDVLAERKAWLGQTCHRCMSSCLDDTHAACLLASDLHITTSDGRVRAVFAVLP